MSTLESRAGSDTPSGDAAAVRTGRVRRILLVTLVMAIGCMVVLGAAVTNGLGADSRMSVAQVVAALRSGEIQQGDSLALGKLPKPWVADAQYAANFDDLSAIYVMRDSERVVLLYHSRGTLFAACTIERAPTWTERWHFCDADLMRDHIERSQLLPLE